MTSEKVLIYSFLAEKIALLWPEVLMMHEMIEMAETRTGTHMLVFFLSSVQGHRSTETQTVQIIQERNFSCNFQNWLQLSSENNLKKKRKKKEKKTIKKSVYFTLLSVQALISN